MWGAAKIAGIENQIKIRSRVMIVQDGGGIIVGRHLLARYSYFQKISILLYNHLCTGVEKGGCTLSLGSDRSTQPYRVRITNEPVDPSSVLQYYYSLQRTKYEYGWANIRTPWCTRKQAISGLRRIRNCSPTMPDFEQKKCF